jgi:hypothetical protein
MGLLGNPDYKRGRNLTKFELEKLSDLELILNFVIVDVQFTFPKSVKYPSIPCYLDESTTIYPTSGESVISGIEYMLAKNQGCTFNKIKEAFIIPFERVKEDKDFEIVNHPFKVIVTDLLAKRKKYPKGTLGNLMEKEKVNSIYGNIVRGISNKKKFDIKTGRTLRMEGSVLSNPIIAS